MLPPRPHPDTSSKQIPIFLIAAGLFAKFTAALVLIPASILCGMTAFLFCVVTVSGMAIVNRVQFNCRTHFVLTACLGSWLRRHSRIGSVFVLFPYAGDNHPFRAVVGTIELIMQTGFAIATLKAMILDMPLPEGIKDTDVVEEEVKTTNSAETDEFVSKDQMVAQKVCKV